MISVGKAKPHVVFENRSKENQMVRRSGSDVMYIVTPNTPIMTRHEAIASATLRYWSGKPCKQGHVALRYASTGNCMECARSNSNAYKQSLMGNVTVKYVIRIEDKAALDEYVAALKFARNIGRPSAEIAAMMPEPHRLAMASLPPGVTTAAPGAEVPDWRKVK